MSVARLLLDLVALYACCRTCATCWALIACWLNFFSWMMI